MSTHDDGRPGRGDIRLSPEDYLAHIMDEAAHFRDALAEAPPGTRVPTCPDWDVDDLLWHLTHVQAFWARMVFDRPTGPDAADTAERPADRPGLLRAFDSASAQLAGALEGVEPTERAWTWHHADHTVGFILRRQAHEALIHRLDAELAVGQVTEVDAELAADCVLECLDVLRGGVPDWGSWEGREPHVRVDCTDTDDQVWVQLGRFTGTDPRSGEQVDEEDLHVVGDPGHEPDVVVEGTAADLAAWLWHRAGEEHLTVTGDVDVHRRFGAIVSTPIN